MPIGNEGLLGTGAEEEVPAFRRRVYLCGARALCLSGMWYVSATSVVVRVECMGVHLCAACQGAAGASS